MKYVDSYEDFINEGIDYKSVIKDKKIIESFELFESKNDPIPEIANIKYEDKYGIFIFGPPASGKSTFVNNYVLRFLRNYKIFNPDNLSNFLKTRFTQMKANDPALNYANIKKSLEDLEKYGIDVSKLDPHSIIGKNNNYVQATDDLLKSELNNYLKGGNTFIYDTTGNDFNRISDYVNMAKKQGYKILFIELKAELAQIIRRNAQRDRTVPISYQMDSFIKSETNLEKFSTLNPDSYYLVVSKRNQPYEFYKYENGKLKRSVDRYEVS